LHLGNFRLRQFRIVAQREKLIKRQTRLLLIAGVAGANNILAACAASAPWRFVIQRPCAEMLMPVAVKAF